MFTHFMGKLLEIKLKCCEYIVIHKICYHLKSDWRLVSKKPDPILTLKCITSQSGQTPFKNLAIFAARF